MFFFFLFQFYTFIHFHGDGASWVIRERKDPSLCGIPRQPSSLAESIFFYIFYLSPPLFFFFFSFSFYWVLSLLLGTFTDTLLLKMECELVYCGDGGAGI